MATISITEAQNSLPELIRSLAPGDVVILTENDRPVAQIVPLPTIRTAPVRPRPPVTGVPRAGTVPGLVVSDDFKEPLS